jgi:hypothetical protein
VKAVRLRDDLRRHRLREPIELHDFGHYCYRARSVNLYRMANPPETAAGRFRIRCVFIPCDLEC